MQDNQRGRTPGRTKEEAMDENRKTLQQWVDESSNIVFFGGAGMSTESGVPDFRSKDGLYNQCYDPFLTFFTL